MCRHDKVAQKWHHISTECWCACVCQRKWDNPYKLEQWKMYIIVNYQLSHGDVVYAHINKPFKYVIEQMHKMTTITATITYLKSFFQRKPGTLKPSSNSSSLSSVSSSPLSLFASLSRRRCRFHLLVRASVHQWWVTQDDPLRLPHMRVSILTLLIITTFLTHQLSLHSCKQINAQKEKQTSQKEKKQTNKKLKVKKSYADGSSHIWS